MPLKKLHALPSDFQKKLEREEAIQRDEHKEALKDMDRIKREKYLLSIDDQEKFLWLIYQVINYIPREYRNNPKMSLMLEPVIPVPIAYLHQLHAFYYGNPLLKEWIENRKIDALNTMNNLKNEDRRIR